MNVIGINDESDIVNNLEQLLVHARTGKIKGFAAVMVTSDGNIMDGYAGIDNDVLITLAGLRILERRIMSQYVEMPEEN